MKIDDMRKDRTVTIEEILPGCVFAWEDVLYIATDATFDDDRMRWCVCIEDGRLSKFVANTSVLLVDAKAVVR